MNTPPQPHVNEPVPPAKPVVAAAPKPEIAVPPAAAPEVSQALYFKGPPREPLPPSHKFVWLGLGLVVCAAAGGGIAWVRFDRRRNPPQFTPGKKTDEDEIRLPRELKVKESTIPAEEREAPVFVEKG
jgi:hypothetical protein